MRSHSTWRETRLVPESTHTHGTAGAPASRDQRVPRQIHLKEAFLKAEPADAPKPAGGWWFHAGCQRRGFGDPFR